METSTPSLIQWHPAFVEALQLELDNYRDTLEFYPEYQLSKGPLKIDCVVIKKKKGVVIKKNIAAIFRETNILEYKSPDQSVLVADFYKAYAYVCLYSSFENVQITKMTLSFVVSRYPRELLSHFSKIRRFRVEESSPGIYTVKGDILPIQVINSSRLSADENLWLKSLSNKLEALAAKRVLEEVNREKIADKVQAYIDVISSANFRTIEEAIRMSDEAKSLDDVFIRTGMAARWEERKALDIAHNLVNLGFPIETVVSATKLDIDKVKGLYQR